MEQAENPAFRKPRQRERKFETTLGYIMTLK